MVWIGYTIHIRHTMTLIIIVNIMSLLLLNSKSVKNASSIPILSFSFKHCIAISQGWAFIISRSICNHLILFEHLTDFMQ